MKKRDGEPWMPADAFGRSIGPGLGVALLVADVAVAVSFQRDVLGAEVIYADPDFAAMRFADSVWLLHADHAYGDHPLHGVATGAEGRGAGAELRLYGCDPDAAEARARDGDHVVLAGAVDKPHGLREAFIIDPDGYVWVPSTALPA